jgi:hypothetical protein
VPDLTVDRGGSWNRFTTSRSSKARRCLECEGYIQQGEIYATWRGLCAEEGTFFTAKICLDCKALWEEESNASGEPMWFGGLEVELMVGDEDPGDPESILARFRANKARRQGLFTEAA